MKSMVVLVCLFLNGFISSGYAKISSSAYEIGTWQGFCTAALTYTFDDLCPNQVPIAVPLLDKYGIKATFYPVINQNPDWVALKKLAANGHEIGSHTMTHTDLKGAASQEDELKNSKAEIEKQIPDSKCITIAYPYCNAGTESLVSKYYVAARGCSGQIESKTPSFLNISSIAVGSETQFTTAQSLKTKINEAITSKGWCTFLIHGIDNDGGYSPLSSAVLDSALNYVSENKDVLWVSTFNNISRYIKERDAAEVQEKSVQDESITLSLTDALADSIYNYPITIRRVLPAGWNSALVTQKGSQLTSSIVTIGTTKYVMFDAVPDNGDITISAQKTPSNSIVAKYGALKRQGSNIVGSNGEAAQVAGPSLYWSIWGGEKFYNSAVVTKVATSWNATLIRAAIAVEFSGGYLEKPDAQIAYAKAVVDAAIENGIYVLVDWHDHNANLHIPQAKAFFSEMSQKYKNTPNIIWEIWNEPDNENGTGAGNADTWKDIKNYADSIIPVIRKNSSNLIVCGTPNWSSDPASAANDPLSDNNVAYTLHFYSGTHGAAVRANAETAMSKGVAVFITEFGTINTTTIKTDTTLFLDEAKTWLDWADAKGLSWANWSLSNIPEACSELVPNASVNGTWTDADLTRSGKWFRDRLLSRSSLVSSDSAKVFVFTEGNGSVAVSPNVKMVKKGASITLTATPEQGWEFKSWSDGVTSTQNPVTLTVDQNISIVANFAPGSGTNMVKGGDFSNKTLWSSWVDDSKNTATISFESEQANILITKSDTINWEIQVFQGSLQLDSGVSLILTFDAWSTAERKLSAGLSTAVTYHYQGGGEVVLTDKKKTYSITMTPDSTTKDGVVSFSCGNSLLPVYIDNVSLVRKSGSSIKISKKHSDGIISFKCAGNRIFWTPISRNSTVMLSDLSGRVIVPETVSNPISLTKLSAGMYLFVIRDGAKKHVFQIMR
jgi:Cellulase (glycosyl hydrolase family 5)/Polysaccharide deacetylase/Divergent InlB B-repeat domain